MASKKDLLARIGKLGAKEFAANKNNLKHTQKELKEIIEILRSLSRVNSVVIDIGGLFGWDSTKQGWEYWNKVWTRLA